MGKNKKNSKVKWYSPFEEFPFDKFVKEAYAARERKNNYVATLLELQKSVNDLVAAHVKASNTCMSYCKNGFVFEPKTENFENDCRAFDKFISRNEKSFGEIMVATAKLLAMQGGVPYAEFATIALNNEQLRED